MSDRAMTGVTPVSDEMAKKLSRLMRDMLRRYPGDAAKLALLEKDEGFEAVFHELCEIRTFNLMRMVPPAERPIWKTIRVGTLPKDKLQWRQLDSYAYVDEDAQEMLRQMEVLEEPTDVNLVLVWPDEINLRSEVPISRQLKAFGLDLCPQEVGPYLINLYARQFRDWERGQGIVIAMKSIKPRHYWSWFRVRRGTGEGHDEYHDPNRMSLYPDGDPDSGWPIACWRK